MRNNTNQLSSPIFKLFALAFVCLWTTQKVQAEVTYAIPLKGVEHQIGNMLEWSTAFEVNSQMFIVERSFDGIDYQNIGVIDAAGISKLETGYRFMDIGVNDKNLLPTSSVGCRWNGKFFTNGDGQKEMSNQYMVVSMSNTVTNKSFLMSIDALDDGELDFQVVSSNGEVILQEKKMLEFGINKLEVNLEDEKEGVYFIRMKMKEEEEMLVVSKVDDEIKKKENVASQKQRSGG